MFRISPKSVYWVVIKELTGLPLLSEKNSFLCFSSWHVALNFLFCSVAFCFNITLPPVSNSLFPHIKLLMGTRKMSQWAEYILGERRDEGQESNWE